MCQRKGQQLLIVLCPLQRKYQRMVCAPCCTDNGHFLILNTEAPLALRSAKFAIRQAPELSLERGELYTNPILVTLESFL